MNRVYTAIAPAGLPLDLKFSLIIGLYSAQVANRMNQAVQQFFDMVQRYDILRKIHRKQTSLQYFRLRYDTKVGMN
jgi:hypothetical protein